MNIKTSHRSAVILSVEDNTDVAEAIADALEFGAQRYDIHVESAGNGTEALELLERISPDLIISDISMPEMNGYDLLERVRAQEQWIHTPFIFLTGQSDRRAVYRGRLTGVEMYLTKPFDTNELVALVETQLEKTFQAQEARERRLQLLQTKLRHMMQHELRTPLTFVTAYSDFLNEGINSASDVEELRQHLRGWRIGYLRLNRLVADLILVLDVRSGELQRRIEAESVLIDDVGSLIERAVATQEAEAQAGDEPWFAEGAPVGIEFEVEIEASLQGVKGVPLLLQDALERVIDNGIKFSKAAGAATIWVSAVDQGDYLEIEVRDAGIGFPQAAGEKLFELFYQHDRNRWEQQGAGVGLTIARNLIATHGGTIHASSLFGGGATFTIRLPFAGKPQLSHSNGTQPRTATVLVVEDDSTLRNALISLLQVVETPFKYHSLAASNGREALDIMQRTAPDLILCDIMMPEVDGLGLLQEVRQNPELNDIPVILATARSGADDILRGQQLGADEYITKPYNSHELLAIIAARLQRHLQKRAVEQVDLDAIKQRVLDSLHLNLVQSLGDIGEQSVVLNDLLDEEADDEDLRRTLIKIRSGSDQLGSLVHNMLTLVDLRTRPARAKLEGRKQPVQDLGELLRLAARQPLAIEEPVKHPPIFGDPGTIETAFEHLLSLHDVQHAQLQIDFDDDIVRICVSSPVVQSSGGGLDDQRVSRAIVEETVDLHNGSFDFRESVGSAMSELRLPRHK